MYENKANKNYFLKLNQKYFKFSNKLIYINYHNHILKNNS